VAFRKHTLLRLAGDHSAVNPLSPSSLFLRHAISRLPELDGQRPAKKKFKVYPIGYFHLDLTEVRTAEGKLYLFVAVDRTSQFAFAKLVERATRRTAADFLQELIEVIPYKIHTVLIDNGTHSTTPGNARSAAAEIKLARAQGEHFRAHSFEVACARHDIDHRLTKPNHPWTNGQVERMNRTIKEATVRTYHYDGPAQLREHLAAFLNAYNFVKRLKTLAGLTSYQFICSCWQKEPERFITNPHRLSSGLNS
jgi:transposase InsO family protein